MMKRTDFCPGWPFPLLTGLHPHLSWREAGPKAVAGCSELLPHPGVGCSWLVALRGALELSGPGVCGVEAGCLLGEPHPRLFVTGEDKKV